METDKAISKRLDYFRFVAAFMIVAIHIGPFAIIGEKTDFLITYCLFRVAVPFFLMVSGYFVVWDYWKGGKEKIDKYLSKLLVLYVAAILIYLPINLYAGKGINGVGHFLKTLLFDGTFYHLWFLPAAILGALLIKFLHWIWGERISGLFVLLLYIIGTLGDSYYGLVSQNYMGKNFYDEIFAFSEYTRNGIFYTPIFLWLGAAVRNVEEREEKLGKGKLPAERKAARDTVRKQLGVGFIVSLFLMILEGLWTYERGWQIHNSMYFMLLPVMYFGFRLLLNMGWKEDAGQERDVAKTTERGIMNFRAATFCRKTSLWIYVLHPLCIILVRGGAKVVGFAEILVDNPFVHFIVVCIASLCMATVIYLLSEMGQKRKQRKKANSCGNFQERVGANSG